MIRSSGRDGPPSVEDDRCTGHGTMVAYCAPTDLRSSRPIWVGPALLATFVGAALLIDPMLRHLTFDYGRMIGGLANVHPFQLPKQASIAVRPFTVAILIVFGAFASGSIRARARFVLMALVIYLPLMVLIDVALAKLTVYGGPSPFTARGNIFDGIAGIIAACLAFFASAKLPANVYLAQIVRRPAYHLVIFTLSIAATAVTVAALFHFEKHELRVLATTPLLGGLLSIVVLFIVLLPVYLCTFGFTVNRVRASFRKDLPPPPTNGHPPLTFGVIVPAHNEAGRIGACVRAIDEAAGKTSAPVTIYVIENGSTDTTYEEARDALQACQHGNGVLLTSSTHIKSRAKAHALNTGLAASTEDVIVRVDADTFVSDRLLSGIAPYFTDPQIGAVGTLPLPHKMTIWIERMRALEVHYGAAFKRSSQGAVDAIPVLPGATVAFRRDILVWLGGFSEGMLGEDSDITVRVGRLGYRIVSDPTIRVFSEQPQSFRELREQRMRWSCGLFHMIGRNRSTISHLQGLRGVWTMPWACFVMFRKLMLIPFAVAAVALILVSHSLFPIKEVTAAGAITLGAQLIEMAVVVTVLGGPSNIVNVPSYIVFRLIVTYFSLETLLTVRLREPRRPDLARITRPAWAVRAGGSSRQRERHREPDYR